MNKIIVASAIFISIFSLVTTVSAQATESTSATPQPSPNLFGGAIAIVGLIIVFAVIAFAGYKIIRKWSSGQSG
jgi:hypothetical protein